MPPVFAGFEERRVETSQAEVELRIGGSGPPDTAAELLAFLAEG